MGSIHLLVVECVAATCAIVGAGVAISVVLGFERKERRIPRSHRL